jgi:predicted short-subunit dehydrogenase-like oxidoreductase (DUF2520 family)
MARTLSIVGAGRVGKTLAKRLRQLGWRIGAVVTRSNATARAAARFIGGGTAHAMPAAAGGLSTELCAAVLSADVILVATPDDLMSGIAEALARAGGRGWRGKVVLHTSGALDRSVLTPIERRGALTGALHPMQTFSGRDIPKLAGVTFAIEGKGGARRVALSLVRLLGGSPVVVASVDKPVYHATASLAAGSAFALIETSVQMLERIGFTRRRALETLLPLTRQMLDNIGRHGPRAAWTGPLSRGDYAVVAKHVRALRRYPKEFQQAYAALALLAGRTLARDSTESLKRVKAILDSSGKNRSRRNRS